MSLTPRQIGDLLMKESPGSPDWRIRNTQSVCVRHFNGLYAELVTYVVGLTPGLVFPDMPSAFGVDDRNLKARKGVHGLADLEIVFTDWAALPDNIITCRYVDLTKDIVTNPIYQTGGAYALAATDVAALKFWKNETNYDAMSTFKYYKNDEDRHDRTNLQTLGTNPAFAAAKIIKGEESYNTGYPVIEARTFRRTRPGLFKGWLRENPPDAYDAPAGYEWIRGNPSRTWNRRYWELFRTWIGADHWDHDHYPAA